MFLKNINKYKYIKNIALKYKAIYFLATALSLVAGTGCNRKLDIKGFDQAAWKQDVRGCKNVRSQFLPALQAATPQLMGLLHNDIIQLLGKPEGNSLEKSGERVYYYFVEPGPHCQNKVAPKANKLYIRFDALDRVYKVRMENNF